jgi:hypothetical protein
VARGNDAEAAAAELKARLGAAPNAEELIALNAEQWPQELRAANNRNVDESATEDLDESDVQGLVGDRTVLGYAVRGPFIVVVSEDDDGFTVKQAFPAPGQEKQAERAARVAAPPEPEPEAAAEPEAEAEEAEAKPTTTHARGTAKR